MLGRQEADAEQRLEIGLEQNLQGFLDLHGTAGQLAHLRAAEMKEFDIAQNLPQV